MPIPRKKTYKYKTFGLEFFITRVTVLIIQFAEQDSFAGPEILLYIYTVHHANSKSYTFFQPKLHEWVKTVASFSRCL